MFNIEFVLNQCITKPYKFNFLRFEAKTSLCMARLPKLNRIKEMLKLKGREGKWLAEQLGVHPNTVSQWKQNNTQPSLPTLYQISILLECDLKDLIASTTPPNKKTDTAKVAA